MSRVESTRPGPFNGATEIGLRALCVLTESFPIRFSFQRLTIFEYLLVHSSDVSGPEDLHPATPFRSGELLTRREALQGGLRLYESRGLIERFYEPEGLAFSATEWSGGFLDALDSEYVSDLREVSAWAVPRFKETTDIELSSFVDERIGEWGSEFKTLSVLLDEGGE